MDPQIEDGAKERKAQRKDVSLGCFFRMDGGQGKNVALRLSGHMGLVKEGMGSGRS